MGCSRKRNGILSVEERPSLHFADRFAAKESYLKALGTGFQGTGIDHIFQEIEIRARIRASLRS